MIQTATMYNTKTFSDVWDEVSKFVGEYKTSGLYDIANTITDDNLSNLYYLLYAKYGNNPIANLDQNQFKYKMFSVIFQYGPAWEKELEIQYNLRNLSLSDLQAGNKVMFKHAYGDATTSSANDNMDYTNDKNEQKTTRAKADAYAILLSLLKDDVTEKFLSKFKHCFKTVVYPEHPLLYGTEIDEDDLI